MARPAWAYGMDLVDATDPITINIRQHHIDDAVAGKGDKCVAARCIRHTLEACSVYIYRSKAYIALDQTGPALRYQLPSKMVRDVIVHLDNSEPQKIVPGIYTLMPPPPGQRLGIDRQPKEGRPKRGPRPNKSHAFLGRVSAAKHAVR